VAAKPKMAIYEVTYSNKTASNDELSFSDIVLVEAETNEELTEKVIGVIRRLGHTGNYCVDSIGGNPYEMPPNRRISKKMAKDGDNLVSIINTRILRRNQGP
jgi:hypothetical protein